MLYLQDFRVGTAYPSASRTILDADIVNFAGLSGDFNPLHIDDVFASNSVFGKRVAHGMLVASIVSGLRSVYDEMALMAFLETTRQFKAAVFPGDTIHSVFTVQAIRPSEKNPDRGILTLRCETLNQKGGIVQSGRDTVLVECRPD
jgi:3-hydroxybutyryl-CoA dehydratase